MHCFTSFLKEIHYLLQADWSACVCTLGSEQPGIPWQTDTRTLSKAYWILQLRSRAEGAICFPDVPELQQCLSAEANGCQNQLGINFWEKQCKCCVWWSSRIWDVKQTQLLSFCCLFCCIQRLLYRRTAKRKSDVASSLLLYHRQAPVVTLELWGTRHDYPHPINVESCVLPFKKGAFDSSYYLKGVEGILLIQACVCGCAPFSGQAVHPGGKPHVAFQGGDACGRGSRADL